MARTYPSLLTRSKVLFAAAQPAIATDATARRGCRGDFARQNQIQSLSELAIVYLAELDRQGGTAD